MKILLMTLAIAVTFSVTKPTYADGENTQPTKPTQAEVEACKKFAGVVSAALVGAGAYGLMTRSISALIAAGSGYLGQTTDTEEECEDFARAMREIANQIRIDTPEQIDEYIEIVCNGDPLCGGLPYLHPLAGLRDPMCGSFDRCNNSVQHCAENLFNCLGTMVDLHGRLNINEFVSALSYIDYGLQLGDWAHHFPNNGGYPMTTSAAHGL